MASRRYMLNLEVCENAAKNAFSRLIHQSGAPVAKFLSRQIDSAAMNLYLAATMLANEKLITQRPLACNPEQQLSRMAARARVQIPISNGWKVTRFTSASMPSATTGTPNPVRLL